MPKIAWIGVGGALLALLLGAAALLLRREAPRAVEASAPRVVRLSEDHWVVPRSIKEQYFLDPQRLNRDLHLKPVAGAAAAELLGLDVDFVDEASPMHAAGFRKGDRILEVNGAPVATMTRALSLSQEVRRADLLTVRVQREGNTREFRCEFPSAP